MSRGIASRLTYANVVATAALFIALGGGAYAAFKVPKNSVGTKQLKNGAVTNKKLRNGAVTGGKVKAGSLTGKQINAATLGTVPNAANAASASNAAALGGTSASGFLHGTGSEQNVKAAAPPGGSAPIASQSGLGTVTGSCDSPCMNPAVTYTNKSGGTQLVQFSAYCGVKFYSLAAGASTPSCALGPTGSSGIDAIGVYVASTGSAIQEAYVGSFVQWSSAGANYYAEFEHEP